MARHELEPYNDRAIVKNIELVFKTGDITKLNKPTYNFVNMLSGFIAHYDLYGFQGYYENLEMFAEDLEAGTSDSDYFGSDWFRNEYGDRYVDSKVRAMQGIAEVVKKYKGKAVTESRSKEQEKLENLHALLTEVIRRNDPEINRAMVSKLEL